MARVILAFTTHEVLVERNDLKSCFYSNLKEVSILGVVGGNVKTFSIRFPLLLLLLQ